jgi:signal transduction histidine kinase
MNISSGLVKTINEIDILSPPKKHLAEILQAICDNLGYGFGSVIEIDGQGDGNIIVSYNLPGDSPGQTGKIEAPILSSPAGEAVETGRIVLLHNPLSDPRMAPWRGFLQTYNIKTMVWVPLKNKGRTMGTYVLYDSRIREVSEEESLELERTAMVISIAIANNRFIDQINQKADELQQEINERKQTEILLNHHLEFIKLIGAISSDFIYIDTAEIDNAVNKALELVTRFTSVERGYIFLLTKDGKKLELTHEWCIENVLAHKGILDSINVSDFEDFVNSLKRGEIARVHAADIPRTPENKSMNDVLDLLEIKSFINLPIIISNKFIGYIGFDATIKETEWSDEVVNAFNLVGEIIGNTLERKRAEELLRESQERLAHQEKLAVLGQLAGGVSHELRNPLGVIKNAAYFLNMAIENPDPQVKETLELLEKEVATSERIINSMLAYAHPRPPLRKKVDINQILGEVLSRIKVPNTIETVYTPVKSLPGIMADQAQLDQAFGNIILNAVQAMPEDGRLTINTDTRDPHWLAISITDTGVGIPRENLEKVFEPLFTGKAKGIGLGMAISKTFVEGHGGSIHAQSEIGKGTTFTVKLPTLEKEERGKPV